jgi:hypothetical protein
MMRSKSTSKPNHLTLEECKIQASILFKTLSGAVSKPLPNPSLGEDAQSFQDSSSKNALKRFHRCPETRDIPLELLKLKHALAVIAFEKGFRSWEELKLQIGLIKGGFLNLWFRNYEEAKAYQNESGGFLLPYKKQFFICNEDYIRGLGLNPEDPAWASIQFDGGKPENMNILRRLCRG